MGGCDGCPTAAAVTSAANARAATKCRVIVGPSMCLLFGICPAQSLRPERGERSCYSSVCQLSPFRCLLAGSRTAGRFPKTRRTGNATLVCNEAYDIFLYTKLF